MEINDFKTIERPMNQGCSYGMRMIEHSIGSLGLARSVVADANNVIIVGDKVYRAALAQGIKKVEVVETDGDTLVVVKRTDVRYGDKKSLSLSLVDNLSCLENIEWNADSVQENVNNCFGFNPIEWGGDACLLKPLCITDLLNDDVEIKNKQVNEQQFVPNKQLNLFD